MAARHPASQRPPPSQLPDSRDERPQTAPAPRAHLRRTSTASPHSSGADQHGAPTTTPSVDQRGGHRAPSRQHSQNYGLDNDGPRDSVSDEIETPRRRTRSSRQLIGATQTRQGPPAPNAHDKQSQPSGPVDAGTLEPHHTHPNRAAQHGQGRGGEAGDQSLRPDTRRDSTRAAEGGVRAGTRSVNDPSNGTPSGTDTYTAQPAPHPPRSMAPDDPFVPEPGSALHDSPPVYQFNRDRYPAYDAHARRIGLEHVRNESTAPQPGQYYRPRTRTYPGPNVSAADYPHVMNLDLEVNAQIPPETGGGSQSRIRSTRTPPSRPHSSSVDPEHEQDGDDLHIPRRGSPSPITGGDAGADPSEEAEADGPPINSTPYLRTMLGLGPEDEVSLNALADPPEGEKPNYPYPTLIKLAIHGSRNKRLTLQDIYAALEERFDWYRVNADDKSWQNSIRHNLSLNKCFRRIPRPITEPGKGSFWTVDYSQGTGNKRERKRNKKPTKAQLRKLAEEEEARAQAAEGRDDPHSPVSVGGSTTSHTVPPSESSRGPVSPVGEGNSPTVECAYSNTPSRSSTLSNSTIVHGLTDAHIDPALRDQGHVVGAGRVRPNLELSRRRSANILPPVQIRQSARAYDSNHSRSPSPRSAPSSRAASNSGPFARPPGMGASGMARPAPPSQHTFGRRPPHTAPQAQFSWPGPHPSHWERYGDNLQQPTSSRQATSSSNALLLSDVPGSQPSSSTYSAGPSSAPVQPEASSSRLPVSNYREDSSNTRRTSKRRIYTDSRGREYPAVGDSYSSASE